MPNLIPFFSVMMYSGSINLPVGDTTHVGVGEGKIMLIDHLPQELQAIVQVHLPEPDGVIAEAGRHVTEKLRLVPFVDVAQTEEIAGVHQQNRTVFFPNRIQVGHPPGNPAHAAWTFQPQGSILPLMSEV